MAGNCKLQENKRREGRAEGDGFEDVEKVCQITP